MKLFKLVVVACLFLGWTAIVFGCGLFAAFIEIDNRQTIEERQLAETIIHELPNPQQLTVIERPGGGVFIQGVVDDQATCNRIREKLIRAIGTNRADEMLRTMGVQQR